MQFGVWRTSSDRSEFRMPNSALRWVLKRVLGSQLDFDLFKVKAWVRQDEETRFGLSL